MTMTYLKEEIRLFLIKNLIDNKPILLGYSGGPDSKALLYLLLSLKNEVPFDLHLLHIDHNQRSTSRKEAILIEKEAKTLKLPCHIKKITSKYSSNIEGNLREERYKIFKEIYDDINAQALLLAHQANDLYETVLQRVLEGANLSNIYAMQEVSKFEGINVWRPLLSTEKEELISWLKTNGNEFFIDETNFDESNLRSRMRKNIFPILEKCIKKRVGKNFCYLSKRSLELKQYLDEKTKKVFANRVEGPFGIYLEFPKSLERIEIRHLIQRLLKKASMSVSRDNIEKIIDQINSNQSNKIFEVENKRIIVDRKILFIQTKKFPKINSFPITFGKFSYSWGEIEITNKCKDSKVGWKNAWLGEISFSLPEGEYLLNIPVPGSYYKKKRLKKWLFENMVPHFFRYSWPVVYSDGCIKREFLSGKCKEKLPGHYHVKISIK